MIRFTTASGAVYLYDTDNARVQCQEGPMNAGLRLDNDTWAYLEQGLPKPDIQVGDSAVFHLEGDFYRVTTPVTHIEETHRAF